MSNDWTIQDSEELYRINKWGNPYFSINSSGHITVSPEGNQQRILDLYQLVETLNQQNIKPPLLIRFSDIFTHRLALLQKCFDNAIARYNYANIYQGVYPLKCNPHRHVVEALVRDGREYNFGLEVGSKPELMIALTHLEPNLDSGDNLLKPCLICNGYKDREYIETALLSTNLGHNVIIVIEQLEELEIILDLSHKFKIKPTLGIRAKLSAKGIGQWANSSGDQSKFGLTIPDILTAVKQLETDSMLSCLQLLHFHIGSQISSISVIKYAIREASQIYVQLVKLGAKMEYLDVGGGLAIDYDGTNNNFYASRNYSLQNYANDIVAEVKDVCEQAVVKMPILISESGRAIASHHSVIIFDVLKTNHIPNVAPEPLKEEEDHSISYLWETYQMISPENYQECYHDAIQVKNEVISLFNLGYLSLQERARAEQIYAACCHKILEIIRHQDYVPDDLKELEKIMVSIYYINLSIFQSIPDTWAIDQLFPIMPIHRLEEEPTQKGILADLTCDSDGKIDKFINFGNIQATLRLHPLLNVNNHQKTQKTYYLGLFLVGAYQEIMGNFHNLFGDTNVVQVKINSDGYEIEQVLKGDTISDVLGYVQYNVNDLLAKMDCLIKQALDKNLITSEDAQRLLTDYQKGLNFYTYLMSNE
jgi:arginine decarboxylase